MTDQTNQSLSFNVTSTNFTDDQIWEFTDTLTKQGQDAGIQDLTTDYAAITVNNVASTDAGLLILANLNNTNTVIWGTTDGEFKLKPSGDFASVRLNPDTTTIGLSAKTNAGSAKLQKYLVAE